LHYVLAFSSSPSDLSAIVSLGNTIQNRIRNRNHNRKHSLLAVCVYEYANEAGC